MVSEKVLRINVERKFLYREIFAILILIEGAQRDNLNGKNKEAQVQLVKKKTKTKYFYSGQKSAATFIANDSYS